MTEGGKSLSYNMMIKMKDVEWIKMKNNTELKELHKIKFHSRIFKIRNVWR